MTLEQAIQKRLFDLCQERNITLSELGTISKVEPSIIDRIVNGTSRGTNVFTIILLCQGLGIEPPDFFCHDTFRNIPVTEDGV